MNDDTLRVAIEAANRFLLAARNPRLRENGVPLMGTRESGAVKRASMDLTRALADLRKPN